MCSAGQWVARVGGGCGCCWNAVVVAAKNRTVLRVFLLDLTGSLQPDRECSVDVLHVLRKEGLESPMSHL